MTRDVRRHVFGASWVAVQHTSRSQATVLYADDSWSGQRKNILAELMGMFTPELGVGYFANLLGHAVKSVDRMLSIQ